MSYKISDIVYEEGRFFALPYECGYEVWENGVTHATKCATIGWKGKKGIERVKQEIVRRLG